MRSGSDRDASIPEAKKPNILDAIATGLVHILEPRTFGADMLVQLRKVPLGVNNTWETLD